MYLCRCDCGADGLVRKDQLTRGVSKSCGCLKKEVASKQIKRLSTTHGMANKTRTYKVWKDMRKRCLNPDHRSFERYGGRGIRICTAWDDYAQFLADMGEAPDGMSLDRIDNDGPYSPKNCRWATRKQQMNNMSTNRYFTYKGARKTLHQISDECGVAYHTLWQRLYRLDWTLAQAVQS